ncbi:hypothetical protein PO124_26275 [Bacillus licheniformis]|nr:hypothetical protein [Bacillus licheniformis]
MKRHRRGRDSSPIRCLSSNQAQVRSLKAKADEGKVGEFAGQLDQLTKG